jgi:hypothetical protein
VSRLFRKYGNIVISQPYRPPRSVTDINLLLLTWNRLYGLMVRVPGYRSRGSGSIPGATRFSGSIPGATRFSEK